MAARQAMANLDEPDVDHLEANRLIRRALSNGPLAQAQRDERMLAFLSEYSQHGNASRAAMASSISHTLIYMWRRQDADFKEAMDWAAAEALSHIQSEVHRRAVDGIDKPLTWRGELTGDTIKEYSDSLLEFELKALAPDLYREHPAEDRGITRVLVVQAEGLMARAPALRTATASVQELPAAEPSPEVPSDYPDEDAPDPDPV